MRVLHVMGWLDPVMGGTTFALAGIAEAQQAAGLEVTVAFTHRVDADMEVAEHLRGCGVAVHPIGPVRGPLLGHSEINPVLRSLIPRMDVVHTHTVWEQIQHRACREAQDKGVPYLISPHGMLDPWSLSQRRWKKRLYLMWRLQRNIDEARAIHCTTTMERDLLMPLLRRTEAVVEPLGVHLREFEVLPESGRFRAAHPEIGVRPIVLFLSRIHYKKGLDLLIPAFAQAKTNEAVLVIAGPDADGYRKSLDEMIASYGIESRVVFTGMLHGTERIEAFVDAEIMVLPSYQENFGIVVVEALASGTPVIISDQVNIWKDIAPAGVGSVVPTRVDALVEQLDRWLHDSTLRESAADRARPFVWETYDWNKIGKRWIDRYRQLAAA